MHIAILGGGFTGLTAAYRLRVRGYKVTVLERELLAGGLASGFKAEGWDWYLERAYHHIFANDAEILGLAADSGFADFFFASPETASLYQVNDTLRVCKLDTPIDLLTFPLLSPVERIRAGAVLAGLKLSPFLPLYEKYSAETFLSATMGEHAYDVLFGELFRKKFGKYAENILSSFIWTRINKRTRNLGYVNGGFQRFIDHLITKIRKSGGVVRTGATVREISRNGNRFTVTVTTGKKTEILDADRVISTLPTPILTRLSARVLPKEYLKQLTGVRYLNAACLILESKQKVLPSTYWLSVCVPEMPMMVILQHTNMVDPKHYGGREILYVANYIDDGHKLLSMDAEAALEYYAPALDRINPAYRKTITGKHFFKAPYAQPIFDADFLTRKPDLQTPTPGLLIANLDMTYPYDRGTNYAVKLGNEVSAQIG
ncbi:MAG: FAD-dependent oxidoreductase [Patescibacteria group bacterium]|nr:FAD-dependent oxidoreductase [Patescibacteria group bacterium]